MEELKLGEKERYDIDKEFIKKYNIKAGDLSPFTRLRVVGISEEYITEDDDIDIRMPSVDDGVDIKAVASDTDELDEIDIKEPSINEQIDIKEVKK